LNIVKVISSLTHGGAETQVINLAKELVAQGHVVTIITTTDYAPRDYQLKNSGVDLVCISKNSRLDLKLLRELRRQFKKIKPDIIHAYLYDAEFYSRLAAIGLKIPLINSERNDQYKLNLNQKLGHFITRHLVDAVVANSFAGCNHAMDKYPNLAKEKFHVVWNGIDLPKIDERLKNNEMNFKNELFAGEKVKLAIMAASIKPQKNHALALDVADKLIEQDETWRVVFLGDQLIVSPNKYKTEIIKLYEKSINRDKIVFLGNREDVIEILYQAEVSFLTSHYEGFPNAVLESMAVGTPAVTTSFSDIKHIAVEPWLVSDDRNAELIANSMIKAEKNKEALSLKSKKWVQNNCNIKVISENLVSVYLLYTAKDVA
jgi:glycosyltransferase involved in cell wall biosynthesis